MSLYYVQTTYGTCCIVSAKNERDARGVIADEIGKNNISLVRGATKDDIAEVKAMGGYIPNEVKP